MTLGDMRYRTKGVWMRIGLRLGLKAEWLVGFIVIAF